MVSMGPPLVLSQHLTDPAGQSDIVLDEALANVISVCVCYFGKPRFISKCSFQDI